jgi:hypothetical protein
MASDRFLLLQGKQVPKMGKQVPLLPGEGCSIMGQGQSGLDGSSVGDVNEVNLVLLQDGIRAYKNGAGRQNIFRGTGYYSRAILNSGARIGNIVDYLKVLLAHTRFLWKRAFQDENSHFAEDG